MKKRKNNILEVQPVSGTVTADKGQGWVDPLTDAQLRASDISITLDGEEIVLDSTIVNDLKTVSVSNFPVDFPLPASQVLSLKDVSVINEVEVTLNGEIVDVSGSSVSVTNFPTDYATANKQLPDNHQVTVSNQIDQPTTPADTQPVSGTVTADKGSGWVDPLTESELRGVVPDETGAWDYVSGTGTSSPTITGRVLQISVTAGVVPATFTINSGDTVTVPSGKSITIAPRANLVDPTISITNSQSYFVEVVS